MTAITDEELAKLERLATDATPEWPPEMISVITALLRCPGVRFSVFLVVVMATPSAVLSLIARLRRAEADRDEVRAREERLRSAAGAYAEWHGGCGHHPDDCPGDEEECRIVATLGAAFAETGAGAEADLTTALREALARLLFDADEAAAREHAVAALERAGVRMPPTVTVDLEAITRKAGQP